jgi:Na+/H+-dicarboxylate symporter
MEAKTLSFVLSPAAVDEISSLTAEVLGKYGVDKTDAIRMRLSVEEVLLIWLDALGEGVKCTFRSGKRLGRQYINVSVAGAKVDPLKVQEESGEFVANTDINILASLGLAPDYQYANGENRVTLMPNKKKLNPMIMLGAAIVLGVISGLLGLLLPVEIRTVLADDILAPLFNAFTGLLTALAGPMMFLSVIWSIYNIGDVATLGRIGKQMVGRYVGFVYVSLILCIGISLPFYHMSTDATASGGAELFGLFQMLLGIIPSNMFTPFTEGNSMQIMFLAVIIGLAMLVLSQKTIVAAQFVEQSNYIVQLIMSVITSLIPAYIFASLLQIILTGGLGELAGAIKVVGLFLFCIALIFGGALGTLSFRKQVPLALLLRKLTPTFLIAVTTASSAATFATSVETSEKEFGIENKLANLGVPLGIVVFAPGHAIEFISIGLFMANFYGVSITLPWLFTAALIAGLLVMAAPPIPGGVVACYTIFFTQLGIPLEGLALAIAMNVVFDFIATAFNMTCLQLQLTMLSTDSLIARQSSRVNR